MEISEVIAILSELKDSVHNIRRYQAFNICVILNK